MTFEADEGNDILVDFEINGEAVEIDPESTTYSITSTSVDAGWQITSAKFTTVDKYLSDSINGIYEDLVKSDNAIAVTTTTTSGGVTTNSLTYASTYGDTDKKVFLEKEDQLKDATSALAKLSKATVKEKLAKADELIEAAKAEIEDTYSALVKTQKAKALSDLEKAFKDTQSTYKTYETEDQRDALIEDGKEAIEECETLEALNKVFASSYQYLDSSKAVKTAKGSYFTLNEAQKAIIAAAKGALEGISEHLLTLSSDSKDVIALTNQQVLIAALAQYGVEVEELPASVAQRYIDEALALREAPTYNTTKNAYQLAIDAKKAVEDSVNNLYTALYKGIVNSYKDEIDALSSDVASDNLKTTIKSKIETVASKWSATGVNDGSDGTTCSNTSKLCDYVGLQAISSGTYKGYLDSAYQSSSLVYTIETALSQDDNVTSAIQNERVKNVLASYKTKWSAELESIKAYDTDYADAITLVKDSTDNTYKAKVENIFVSDSDSNTVVANPVFGDANADSSKVERKKSGSYYYSAEAMYQALVEGKTWTGSAWSENKTKDSTDANNYLNGYYSVNHESYFANALAAKTWAETVDGSITKSYRYFMADVARTEEGLVTETFGDDQYTGTYVTEGTISDAFESAVFYTNGTCKLLLSKLNEYTQSALKSTEALKELDKKVVEFVGTAATTTPDSPATGKQLVDSGFDSAYVTSSYSTFNSKVLSATNEDSAFSKCLAGNMSKTDVDSFAETFESIYKEDVLTYTQGTLSNFQKSIESLMFNSGITEQQKRKLNTAAEIIESLFDDENGMFVLSDEAFAEAYKIDTTTGSETYGKYIANNSNLISVLTNVGMTTIVGASYDATLSDAQVSSLYSIKHSDNFVAAALAFAKNYASIAN